MTTLTRFTLILSTIVFCADLTFGQDKQTIHLHFTEQDTNDQDILGEKLLLSGTWQTCAWIDSINQYYKIQLIKKDLIDSLHNCTSNGCAYSDWTFEIENGEKKLSIFNSSGCPDAVLMAGGFMNWNWEYDTINRVIRLLDDKGEDIFHLRVSQISENRLFLVTLKQND